MILRRTAITFMLGVLAALASAAPAAAEPVWNLDLHHNQTHFAPGGIGEYWFEVGNIGSSNSSGSVMLKVVLPAGVTRFQVLEGSGDAGYPSDENKQLEWSCPGAVGDKVITCTTAKTIYRHTIARALRLQVKVNAAVEAGTRVTNATLEGGGAPFKAEASEPTQIDPAPAGFGILPQTFVPDFTASDGRTPVRESGAHPPLATFPFDFQTIDAPNATSQSQKTAAENIRDLEVLLPQGFVGAPTAIGECTQAEFSRENCPASSQVGRLDLLAYNPVGSTEGQTFITLSQAVYNLSHPRGTVTDLAANIVGNPVHIKASLDPANNYAIRTTVSNINELVPVFNQKLTVWGVPADPSHDAERCGVQGKSTAEALVLNTSEECSTDKERKPFLTVPSRCDIEPLFRLRNYDSWDNTGVFGPEIQHTLVPQITDCDRPRFEPDVEIVPTGKQANTPTGLDVHIKVAQNDNPNALNTPPVQRITVRLPGGMSFSPSFADGLRSCTLAQMKLGTDEPIQCPDASRIGEVTLSTPLLPKPAEGSMYLAAQRDNPFGSTFALLLVLHDTEERGALIKIPGRIDVDPVSGQITTVFQDTPQFPFEDLTLKFRSGPRAPLVNPPACGTQTIEIEVASYAQPQTPVDASNTYQVTEGPGGTPCPPDPAHRPFSPSFSGGTLSPIAGSYSTFLFRLSRGDAEQELSQVTSILPPGVVAKIAGIPFCPDRAIVSISTAEGAGAQELQHPACPAASQIGTISAGLGAGPGPNYFGGKVYLAGPYKGAPLSLAIVVPGVAGPFDLGNAVVRAALQVDPETSRVTAVSDPFPTILHGVILRVRDVRLRIDRRETTINPTNCSPMSVNSRITGVGGQLLSTADDSFFDASAPFQVASCTDLGFKPRLTFKLKGGTHRGDHPAFFSRLVARAGDANIGRAVVALPHSEFLDQANIGTICTRVQFAQDACPPDSVYGHARAITPLLDGPVEGDLILRSSNHLLPDLVARLRGQINANLVGRIDSVNGGIRTTFDSVPDVPVKEFILTMAGGKKGLLVNSRNLCKAPSRADVRFTAQSGKRLHLRPLMQNRCKKANNGKKRRPKRG
jgi:hypothetical protein